MADDWHCKQMPNGQHPIIVCERETLLAEIERLRSAGDALAKASALDLCYCDKRACVALRDAHRAWKEARRG